MSFYINPIISKILLKNQKEFHGHYANNINKLIYQNNSHEHEHEYLTQYHVNSYPQFIKLSAKIFDSPIRVSTSHPLGILTNTHLIFQLRRKRFRKVINGGNGSSSSGTYSSLYSSGFQKQTVLFLMNSFSEQTYESLDMEQYYGSSVVDIYTENSDCLEENIVKRQRSFQQIRSLVESHVKHLILTFNTKSSNISQQLSAIKQASSKQERFLTKISKKNQIQSQVRAQLRKYNIFSNSIEPFGVKQRKKVREKAQELLKDILQIQWWSI